MIDLSQRLAQRNAVLVDQKESQTTIGVTGTTAREIPNSTSGIDKVQLSSAALNSNSISETRQSKVDRLRKAVNDGTYTMSSQSLAQAIIRTGVDDPAF